MTARPVPVCIRGVHYPSIAAAARALGVTPGCIQHALNDGNVDRVGTGQSRPKEFIYEGVTYRSQAACARAYGIASNTFNYRLSKGRNPITGDYYEHTPPHNDDRAA